ncbi:DUF2911 domain-containing protein [Echinicola jeungdonensis]|uniref:DUF2911 domain-containing protein n=1 Tax=Echinicola jeungdonensis TaxID=709343 RepID=A0ABV5J6E7_9BACT|nr:DUF2911 domain-containing protein [Echinicola jeungdonensis]MDN3670888.1 DUF2911 domain-containing protein [Echinicola jeungdonensis]
MLGLFCSFFRANGQQLQIPQASPSASLSQKIGLTDVRVDYCRPSVKGRKIFGTLVPYGTVWRTGANAATKISFSNEVTIEGHKVKKGTYALYTIPNKKQWTIILSNNTELWGAIGYQKKDDALRFTVDSDKLKPKYETLEISFGDLSDTGASLSLKWEKTEVQFRIETEVDSIVMNQIEDLVINPEEVSPGLYYQAAYYYFTKDKDMKLALEWIKKSVENDSKYWTEHLKAKIEDKLGLKNEAIKSASKSKELAMEAKNLDYVGLNDRLIKSIK